MIHDKKPSAYSAMKHGETISHSSYSAPSGDEPVKKGRPSKEDARKHKIAMASAAIAMLMSGKPKKADIRDYIAKRVATLDEEKK
jgi:hypothetical protein